MKSAGFEIVKFEEVSSTNDIAAEYAQKASSQRLIIVAKRQTAGRGRRGRNWQSLSGNLFFSMLFEFPLQNLGCLVMASALALLEAIKQYGTAADVRLKWPNDVLVNGAKVSGMLLEKAAGEYMIVGIGVNIAQSPKTAGMLYPTISLAEVGIKTSADAFLEKYLQQFVQYIGLRATDLQHRWLENAKGVGQKIAVKQNDTEIKGVFERIDENADLILKIGNKEQKILAGDVFYLGEHDD